MLNMVITTAGRQALINSSQTGTNAVKIAKIGVGSGKYTPSASQTALQSEIKKLNIIEGGSAGDNSFHVAYQDDTEDAYSIYEFGLFLEDGTLFAAYSSTNLVMQKTASGIALLAVDISLDDVDVENITFGSVTFTNAAATTANAGVLSIATDDDVQAGTVTQKALTPKNIRALTATDARPGLVNLATAEEAKIGADNAKAITSVTAKAALDNRIATNAETIAGTDATKLITPAGLSARTATTARKGIVELATNTEAIAGTDAERVVTPAALTAALANNLKDATTSQKGIVQLATEAETTSGATATKAVTPVGVNAAISGYSGTINNAKVVATGGTTARTLAARFADGITPKDFGASGNGTVNDSAAFTALEAKVTGRDVDLEGLTYLVTTKPIKNNYYNGSFKVGSVTEKQIYNIFDDSGSYWNAAGKDNVSFYPSGKSSFYLGRAGTCQFTQARFTNDENGTSFVMYKSRSTEIGKSASLKAGDKIGQITFLADNGNINYSDTLQGARASWIEGGVFESSSLTTGGTTNVGVRGYITLRCCSDTNSRNGEGLEVIDNGVRFTSDNVANLGTAARRWKAVYAATDVISTSDESTKQDIVDIPDEVIAAWGNVNFKQFRFKSDVLSEGEDAKLYCGVIAQQILEVFSAAGIDACDYGLVCKDEQEDGSVIYGVRYREALVLEAAYQRKRIADLEARLSALETA